jgi:integral membrane protein
MLNIFRKIAFYEGISFLIILLITMPLKYYADIPEPNKVIGMAHGVLFITYFFFMAQLIKPAGWSWKTVGFLVLASIIPFGTFVAEEKILKKTKFK